MLSIDTLKGNFDLRNVDELKKYLLSELTVTPAEIQPNWHPLGFIHAKLAEEVGGQTYRLHIWPSDQAAIHPQEHKVHDHLFDVTSIVLAGSVQNVEYDLIATDLSRPTHRILRVDYSPSGPRLYEDGSTGTLVQSKSKTVPAGASYEVKQQVLHETNLCSSRTAVTLVRTSNPTKYNPRVAVPISEILPPIRQHVPFPKETWLALLQQSLR